MLEALWIRADGSTEVGLGHLSRTSALAEAAIELGVVVRYVTTTDDLARAFLERRALDVQWLPDAADRGWLAAVGTSDAIVLDRYDVTSEEVAAARGTGAAVGVLDDHGVPELPADLVVNPNDGVDASRLPSSTIVAAGPEYALVRAAFRRHRRTRWGSCRRLLVTMGGSDNEGRGAAVLAALAAGRPFDEVVVVEGPGARPIEHPPRWVVIVRDPPEIAEVFDSADAAISAGGATCWELLTMGIPTAVVAVSDNQRGVVTRAVGAGAALELSPAITGGELAAVVAQLATADTQRALSETGLRLVDGSGPARVLALLERI